MWAVVGLLFGLLVGILLDRFMHFQVTLLFAKYISVSFLAGLDSVLGALRAGIEEKFDVTVFITGFITNALLAALLTYVGDRLGVDLYLAAVVTFGVRIFENLGYIRRDLIVRAQVARSTTPEA